MSNKVIYKCNLYGSCLFKMPPNTQIISVGTQGDNICMWAIVDPDASATITRHFDVVPTGLVFELTDSMKFIGTVVLDCLDVYHVFEVIK